MRWFIHYFENGGRVYSEQGGHRIANEAKNLLTEMGLSYFDHVITYRKIDLGLDFVNFHSQHFMYTKGAGYWLWKPRIIQLTLQKMAMGDILMYADTGCQIKGSLEPLFDHLKNRDVVVFELPTIHSEQRWTKADLFRFLNVTDPKMLISPQRIGTYLILRKTPQTVKLIERYVSLSSNLHLLDDSPSIQPNHPTFTEHRHDQSIWSLLTKLEQIPALPDCGWPPELSTTISASRLTG